uniref:Uncharacterized protein n=1 Tax=Setaria digitata TaxID=48799 RepID=A0A915PDE7_9BILA
MEFSANKPVIEGLSMSRRPVSIIITLCLGSTWCFRDAYDEKSQEDEDDQWVLQAKIAGDCKSDEHAWMKPAVIGYLVGLLLGAISGVTLCIAFVYHLHIVMVLCFTVIHCQELKPDFLFPGDGVAEHYWIGDDETGNCDVVEEASWSRYFFRGMIVGFLIGLSGGVLFGFLCWKVRVHKENYNL